MPLQFKDVLIRAWEPRDRHVAATLIGTVLQEYGLGWEPNGADQDVLQVETAYHVLGGEFWVAEQSGSIVGTAAYRPINRGTHAVEIRKMYLSPLVRGQGLGLFLLQTLETAIAARGYQQIWLETASALKEAIRLYERNGYQPETNVETARCDRAYSKKLPKINNP